MLPQSNGHTVQSAIKSTATVSTNAANGYIFLIENLNKTTPDLIDETTLTHLISTTNPLQSPTLLENNTWGFALPTEENTALNATPP
ncbi:hypothetical protein FACS1894191_1390 [Clostridia bacterium]|nr:hypothetical protein FACS1894191_1390 [Clostridia bacterium]